jgi:hypothetical protein
MLQDHAAGVGLDQPDQQPCHGGLAAARLADHAQGFALGDRQRQIVDRAHHLGSTAKQAAHDREVLAQTLGQQ